MAAATRKAPCCICGKEKGGVRCEGCSRIFCMNDFANHRQELNQQLDEVAVTRDLTQEILIDKKAEPQKNPLIGQINAWELESINIIKEAAEQARQTLFKHSTTLYTQIEDRLNKLTDQLRLAREDNDLFETDIHLWKQNLAELQSELTEPPTVRIQHGSEPLITNIIIDTLGNLGNDTSNTTIRPNASATFQHATSSDSITGYNKQITRIPADLITYSTIPNVSSSQSNSEKKITTQCLYCFEQCEIGERLLHQEICLKNPDNIAKKQWAMINTNSNSNSSSNRWNRRIEPDNNDNIPYETRQKETEWYNYNDHTESNTSRRFVSCSFCNEELPSSSLGEHLMMCGNKTNECPWCRKFIRRAVYVYHRENNCANLDNFDNDTGLEPVQLSQRGSNRPYSNFHSDRTN
ncbi:unnamed protein product [Adineta steineri]|uniref:Uncharacterized protein n=1 Tax=Adineta steineri TaxID=433720 RepID=A0A819X7N0_9BILA|nr:unnamed protein product [Adineta steineri]